MIISYPTTDFSKKNLIPRPSGRGSSLKTEGFENIELFENVLVTTIKIAGIDDNKKLMECIDKITRIYNEFGVQAICQLCKLNAADGYYNYNNEILPLCDDCVNKTNTAKDELKSASLQSYVTGSLGALIGALLGSIVWIIIGLLGFYASIGGVAISYASFTGYTKLGGKSNRVSIIIIILSILIAVVFSELVGLGIEVAKYLKSEDIQLGLVQIVQIMIEIIKDGESIAEMIPNMLFGLLFAGLGSLGLIKKMFQTAKAADIKIEKI